jgi:hypothetical protein
MWVSEFDPVAALAEVKCPRCSVLGLLTSDDDRHRTAPAKDRHVPEFHMSPSLYCRCGACGLEAEWPGWQESP